MTVYADNIDGYNNQQNVLQDNLIFQNFRIQLKFFTKFGISLLP